jgi:hypothetical protein
MFKQCTFAYTVASVYVFCFITATFPMMTTAPIMLHGQFCKLDIYTFLINNVVVEGDYV